MIIVTAMKGCALNEIFRGDKFIELWAGGRLKDVIRVNDVFQSKIILDLWQRIKYCSSTAEMLMKRN